MTKKLIYSVVTNRYDDVKPVANYPDFDFWLFTDQHNLEVDGWEIKTIPRSEDPIRQQRLIKINSCKFTDSYGLTIYIDGNMEIIQDPQLFLDKYFRGGFLTCIHPKRKSLKEEASEIIRKKKDLHYKVTKTLAYAKDLGYPDNLGLFESMVIVRDKSKEVEVIEEKWAEILSKNSHRDQLSLPLASFLSGVRIQGMPRDELFKFIKRNRGHNVSLKFLQGRPTSRQKEGMFRTLIEWVKEREIWFSKGAK